MLKLPFSDVKCKRKNKNVKPITSLLYGILYVLKKVYNTSLHGFTVFLKTNSMGNITTKIKRDTFLKDFEQEVKKKKKIH